MLVSGKKAAMAQAVKKREDNVKYLLSLLRGRQFLFGHTHGLSQITPSCLPTFSKAPKTLSNCSSVWVAM
jgi:hypothetical protein